MPGKDIRIATAGRDFVGSPSRDDHRCVDRGDRAAQPHRVV